MDNKRYCPCCGQLITGSEENQLTRGAIKMGTKIVVKEGSKVLLGTGATTTGAEIGAAIGSIVPVVGTTIGAIAGGAIAHMASEFVLDQTYDAVEKELCPRTNYYYCPNCDLSWTSNDYEDRDILIKNYKNKYELRAKKDPEPPTKEVEIEDSITLTSIFSLVLLVGPLTCLFILHIFAYTAYFFTFTLWDPTVTTWGWIKDYSLNAFLLSLAAYGLVALYYLIKKAQLYIAYKKEMRIYNAICLENKNYNDKLKSDLLKELNTILEAKSMDLEYTL